MHTQAFCRPDDMSIRPPTIFSPRADQRRWRSQSLCLVAAIIFRKFRNLGKLHSNTYSASATHHLSKGALRLHTAGEPHLQATDAALDRTRKPQMRSRKDNLVLTWHEHLQLVRLDSTGSSRDQDAIGCQHICLHSGKRLTAVVRLLPARAVLALWVDWTSGHLGH